MMELKQNMKKSIDSFKERLSKIRTGRANSAMLDSVRVDYFGSEVPINHVATISIADARTIVLDVWDKNMVDHVLGAIKRANLGFNPNYDGNVVRISVPALTEERRKEFAKQAKAELENAKISLRNVRHKELAVLKSSDASEDERKRKEKDIQKELDSFVKEAEDIYKKKEKEIMTV